VVNDRIALNVVDLADKETIDVKTTASDNEILGAEFLCRHDDQVKPSRLKSKGLVHRIWLRADDGSNDSSDGDAHRARSLSR